MFTPKKVVLIVVASLLVVGGILTVVFWPSVSGFINGLFHSEQASPSPSTSMPTEEEIRASQRLYNAALTAAADGGAEAGQKVLDDELEKASSKTKRAEIYTQKSTLANSPNGGNNIAQALQYAYQADAEAPDYGTALLIAETEYYLGDKTKALQYYKLYLDRMTEEAIALNPGDKEAIEKRVAELEASL